VQNAPSPRDSWRLEISRRRFVLAFVIVAAPAAATALETTPAVSADPTLGTEDAAPTHATAPSPQRSMSPPLVRFHGPASHGAHPYRDADDLLMLRSARFS